MKWGVRRYQNKDGSLTKAGEERYGTKKTKYKVSVQSPFERKKAKLEEKEKRMSEKEELRRRANELKERQKNLKNLGKSKDTIQNEQRAKAAKKKNARDMTDDELREFINRYELEKKYEKIANGPEKKRGAQAAKEILAKSATQVATKYTAKAMETIIEEMIKKARRGSSGSGSP